MFALAREHADKTGREAVMLALFYALRFHWHGSLARRWLSLSDGFQLYGNVSERSGSVYVCGVMVWLFLPSMQKELPLAPARLKRRAVTVAIRCCCLSLYIDVGLEQPVHHQHAAIYYNELHLPEKLAGVMMGTAAGLKSRPC